MQPSEASNEGGDVGEPQAACETWNGNAPGCDLRGPVLLTGVGNSPELDGEDDVVVTGGGDQRRSAFGPTGIHWAKANTKGWSIFRA